MKEIEIQETNYDFSMYYETNKLSNTVDSKFKSTDFLAIPRKYEENEYYFAQETVDFIKYCKVSVNSDTPTQSPFFPLYYTKTIGGSMNGQKKVHNQTRERTVCSKLSC